MLKYIFIFAILTGLFACNRSTNATKKADVVIHAGDTVIKPIPPVRLIVAGKSVGSISINGDANSVIKKLGKPDKINAGMGASLMTWYKKYDKKKYQTTIYARRQTGGNNAPANAVKEIRVTSPWFKTADYAGAGCELKDMQKLYKLKKHPSAYANAKKLALYDDYGAGIGFEVDSTGKCTAVLVYARGDSSVTYVSMH